MKVINAANPTRHLAQQLRDSPVGASPADCRAAAAVIDALLDAIEAGGMVQPRPAPVMDLGPLRELRQWHRNQANDTAGMQGALHRDAVAKLNAYFPEGDKL